MDTTTTDENELYHQDTSRISKSKLDIIETSPLHYWAKFLNPNRKQEPDKAWGVLGNAFHTAVLEPSKFDKRYIVIPDNAPKKPTSAQVNAKNPSADTLTQIEWWARFNREHAGKSILDASDYEDVRRMQDAVFNHPSASQLLASDLTVEETFEFDEPTTGAPCKIRRDAYNHKYRLTLDLKTTDSAHPEDFAKSAFKYRYHVQDAFYTDGYSFATGEYPDGFVFIAVEKKPPYAVACYRLTATAVNIGREAYLRNLDTYMKCIRSGEWPGYSDLIENLELPKWAYKVM